MSENEHPIDFLPELALGVLPEEQAFDVRQHLETCEACRAEHDEMAQAARLLPYAVEDVEPRPAIREGLMERIATEPRVLQSRVIRPAWQRFAAIAAAAAVLVVVGGFAGTLFAGGGDDAFEEEATRQRTLVRAVADGNARRETSEQGNLTATLVYAPGAQSAFAKLDGLPPLAAGKAYQAWFIADGPPMPSDVFKSASDGVWLKSPEQVANFAAFAVTIEDEEGVQASKEQPVLVLALGQTASSRQPISWSDWLKLAMRD